MSEGTVVRDAAQAERAPGPTGPGVETRIEVHLPAGPHAGLDGLRVLLRKLWQRFPGVLGEVAASRPMEWRILQPENAPEAPELASVTSTCSERRLHAESEQVYRLITTVGQAVRAVADQGTLTLRFHRTADLDLPTLRALGHLSELTRAGAPSLRLELFGTEAEEPGADLSEAEREIWHLRDKLVRASLAGIAQPDLPAPQPPAPDDVETLPGRERDALRRLREASSAEEAAAAAMATMRAAFFSTNLDVGGLAAYHLLALTAPVASALNVSRVRELLAGMDLGDDPGSIGVDADAVLDGDSLAGLAHRYLGMVHTFANEYAVARRHLVTATGLGPGIVRARAHLLLALLLIKRMKQVEDGFEQVALGLKGLEGDDSRVAEVEAAWLHNVKALGHVQVRELKEAMREERRAMQLIGRLSTTDATHLKINLLSNISVLREYTGDHGKALEVWRRFTERSQDWAPTFFKHHRYREAGLLLRQGAADDALALLEVSYHHAVAAGDDFYAAQMSLEQGALLLPTDRRAAAAAFARAVNHARNIGEPDALALGEVGQALAEDRLDEEVRRRAVELGRPGSAWRSTVSDGTPDQVASVLPTLRTKLNRPFMAVRPELVETR